jgi:hypothetical protein
MRSVELLQMVDNARHDLILWSCELMVGPYQVENDFKFSNHDLYFPSKTRIFYSRHRIIILAIG